MLTNKNIFVINFFKQKRPYTLFKKSPISLSYLKYKIFLLFFLHSFLLYLRYFGFLFIRAMCLCAKWDSDSPTISNQDLINGVLSLLLFFFSPEFFFALPDISMNFLLQKSLGLSTRTRIYAWMHVMYQRDLVPF